MHRRVIAGAIVSSLALAGAAHAETPKYDPDDPGQALGATVGVATGSSVTPGGFRAEGHYLYQVTQDDWLEGTASLTLGGGTASCFYDRGGDYTCEHGLLDGRAAEITGAVRHNFTGQKTFTPFTNLGLGVALARFGEDSVTGLGITLRGGAGIAAGVADNVAVIARAEAALGGGIYGHGLGGEVVFGLAVLVGAEFSLE